ncbi:hypothetical protein [Geobacter benzoatilyticus]|uniref:Type I restriction modification DNA specificity domain-containing protein n=1 Tax=Geobacter benzoatilyticus TaxID=2815309 RepID=A0ABX7Q1G5_9BACT|nr:hypothetical protein [Geobacter benzoatilyticus]QSV44905.1 hypothetical protein JZM60_12185 [Geobacter benzoatilyticus]
MSQNGGKVGSDVVNETITIPRAKYDGLLATIKRQKEEVEALEYRIKTLLTEGE